MLISNKGGSGFPFKREELMFDVLCAATSTYNSAFLYNVSFYGFRQNYDFAPKCPSSIAIGK